jgi:hypothetical protein
MDWETTPYVIIVVEVSEYGDSYTEDMIWADIKAAKDIPDGVEWYAMKWEYIEDIPSIIIMAKRTDHPAWRQASDMISEGYTIRAATFGAVCKN